ncbi:hypothetical protein [Brevibacterium luteolum]|uniref:hypothetical protein n=1 Tax=Brevibacterium luteolum TaxID=199591 RepID=UPI00223B8258|nr:hypothetical protein [Brevibacterium luteolum]MCT1658209.1 hypothetical protein [Brevibacterium luteolum]MCT1920931.1 hypothetical protein [Brevibacterium luteolum]
MALLIGGCILKVMDSSTAFEVADALVDAAELAASEKEMNNINDVPVVGGKGDLV